MLTTLSQLFNFCSRNLLLVIPWPYMENAYEGFQLSVIILRFHIYYFSLHISMQKSDDFQGRKINSSEIHDKNMRMRMRPLQALNL